MPRRVLLMISSMRGGGSERQTLLLLRHLDRESFEPHLYLTERAGDLLADVPADVIVHSHQDAPPDRGIYYPGRQIRYQSSYLADVIRSAKIDVIYDRTFHMTLIAEKAALRCEIPRVSTIVSPPHHALPHVEKRFVRIKRWRLSSAYRRSRHVIAVSRQAAESAERYYGLTPGSAHVIANPVDVEQLRRQARLFEPARDGRTTVVCVGRMSEEKGHRDLVEALRLSEARWPNEVSPLRVWMIGDGPLKGDLQARAGQLSKHQCEFLGAVANPASYIAAADSLVLPSHFEGMPNVVLEAFALGTPVIATRAGGTIELEDSQPTILWAEPRDPASLCEAILSYVADPDSGRQRAAAAEQLITQNHDATKTTSRIESLLDDTG